MGSGRTAGMVLALVALLAMGVISALDYLTGHEISFSVFYLLPIGFLAWRTTLSLSLAAAVLGAALWFGADAASHQYSHPFVGVWNAVVRLTIFVFAAVTLDRLQRLLRLEQVLARTDSQTGVYNARAFREILETEILRSRRTARPFSLVFLDLDHFKTLNDRFGHAVGDQALRQIGNVLVRCVRGNDAVGRLGGDEFAILLTESDEAQTRSALDRVRQELASTLANLSATEDVRVTASLGVVFHQGGTKLSSDELLRQADALMYRAKQLGRDQLVFGGPEIPNGDV